MADRKPHMVPIGSLLPSDVDLISQWCEAWGRIIQSIWRAPTGEMIAACYETDERGRVQVDGGYEPRVHLVAVPEEWDEAFPVKLGLNAGITAV